MTFDMGNWHWSGECPLQAAAALAPQVRYVHCKGVQRQPQRWVAVPLAESSAPWRAVLRALPADCALGHRIPAGGRRPARRDAHRKSTSCAPSPPAWQCAATPSLKIHTARKPLMTSALDVITFGEAMMLLVADRPGPLEAGPGLLQAHRRR